MVYDLLPDIVHWLEECLRGELPVLVGIDQEGRDGHLVMRPGKDEAHGVLQVLDAFQDPPRLQAQVHRETFVARFIRGLRRLVQGRFNEQEWCMAPYFLKHLPAWEGERPDSSFGEAAKAYQRWLLGLLDGVEKEAAGDQGLPFPGSRRPVVEPPGFSGGKAEG